MSVEEEELLWGEGSVVNRTELVLLHFQMGASPLPRGTHWWLDARPQVAHWHHVRTPLRADFDRLVRHLAGCAVGLTLAGGGSRGLAHLGVLKACVEQDIPVDFMRQAMLLLSFLNTLVRLRSACGRRIAT